MDIRTNYGLNQNISMKGALSTIAKEIRNKDQILETTFDELAISIPKSKDGIINKKALDKEDKAVFNEVAKHFARLGKWCEFEDTIANVKEYFKFNLTRVTDEMYNSAPAKVARNLLGNIVSVRTEATNAKDAARLMGLDRFYYMQVSNGKTVKNVPLYYHETLYPSGTVKNRDCFKWNDETLSMQFDSGVSDASDGACKQIKDFHKSY